MGASTTTTTDEERKRRLIAHMNRSHTRELNHYIRHYAGASRGAASEEPALSDISLSGMTITAGRHTYAVPLSPPLASWDEARGRLVAMAEESRKALGVSDVVLDEWVPPTGLAAVTLASIAFYYVSYFTLPWTGPGTAPWRIADAVFPGGAPAFRWITRVIFWPVIAIHVVEAIIFARTKMNEYSVPVGSRVWWLWVLNCFVVGFPTFKGIDAAAARKRELQGAKSH